LSKVKHDELSDRWYTEVERTGMVVINKDRSALIDNSTKYMDRTYYANKETADRMSSAIFIPFGAVSDL